MKKALLVSSIGAFIIVFSAGSAEAASPSADRCNRFEGTDRYDRCIERVNQRTEFKAAIESACGERPDRDADSELKQNYRECAHAKKQELKDSGEFVPHRRGRGRRGGGHAFGRHFGMTNNLPEDVQAQIQSLMEQIRALIEQHQQ